tara:strand:- start:58 stop:915 length:858 start_codon:yes stop_codon:yes gene_type:complete
MGSNILIAIKNIISFNNYNLKEYASSYDIRINASGEALELFVKDAIADCLEGNKVKNKNYEKIFSWTGNQNNPPDLIINYGDSFEIKKIQGNKSNLQLNSSPPKDKLLINDHRITINCKECEDKPWKEKDIFYTIGFTQKNNLKYIIFIQGTCYAADHEIYARIHDPIKKEVDSILDSLNLEKGKSVEIGKVKKVDPLGITDLRLRGMWSIKNPLNIYPQYLKFIKKEKFHLFTILKKEKYLSFPINDRELLEKNPEIIITDITIKNPNNPAKILEAKLIKYIEK